MNRLTKRYHLLMSYDNSQQFIRQKINIFFRLKFISRLNHNRKKIDDDLTKSVTVTNMKRNTVFIPVILVLFLLTSCEATNKLMLVFPTTVTGAIEIGPEWTEISLPTPLTAKKGTQRYLDLFFEYSKAQDNLGGKDGKTMVLADGRSASFDIYIYDENGKEYQLYVSSRGGSVGFSLSSPPGKKFFPFPDVKYVKLKIKSSVPVKLAKIEWIGSVST
jgi:hypothetical protein